MVVSFFVKCKKSDY